jgi:hypothetical protein
MLENCNHKNSECSRNVMIFEMKERMSTILHIFIFQKLFKEKSLFTYYFIKSVKNYYTLLRFGPDSEVLSLKLPQIYTIPSIKT